jgi:hypothetical protein
MICSRDMRTFRINERRFFFVPAGSNGSRDVYKTGLNCRRVYFCRRNYTNKFTNALAVYSTMGGKWLSIVYLYYPFCPCGIRNKRFIQQRPVRGIRATPDLHISVLFYDAEKIGGHYFDCRRRGRIKNTEDIAVAGWQRKSRLIYIKY